MFGPGQERQSLPYLLREDQQQFPVWKMLSKFGNDLSKVAVPVTANQPLSMLQVLAEVCLHVDVLEQAASLGDSVKRTVWVAIFSVLHFNCLRKRQKKPFNPLLGETFEHVHEKCRFYAEQVSHHPPISAFKLEGKGYQALGHCELKTEMKFGGGTGCFSVEQKGLIHFNFDNGEVISVSKPNVEVHNLVMGNMFLDLTGSIRAQNHISGAWAEITFNPRSWNSPISTVTGFGFDRQGNKLFEVSGSWLN